jgi:haloalkane dehalogenase
MLRLVGGRFFSAVNTSTNLLARSMSSPIVARAQRAPRVLTRAERVAFRGPFRDRQARRNAVALLGDVATANTYLREVDKALRTTLGDRPMVVIFGAKSPVRKEFLPQWRERFPHAQVVLVERGHHFPPIDAPDLVATTIHSWWRETVHNEPEAREA